METGIRKEDYAFLLSVALNPTPSYTVKKGLADSRPQPGCHLPNSPWPGIIYPIPVP